ncbi:MAG TPA: hypothetical protein VNK23_17210 [Candidatus Dormibacteraeota bacterium]|nr:hypothetical protein [Candidatus Dormibacteraeota bacterium]
MSEALSPVETVRQARREFQAWLEAVESSRNPARERPQALQRISQLLQEVDGAMRLATLDQTTSCEWREEMVTYRETLRDLRTKLGSFDIILRIRRNQLTGARARASAASAWANLARHIG